MSTTLHAKPKTIAVDEYDYCGFRFLASALAGATVVSGTVSVLPAAGLTLGSQNAIVTPAADGVYAWITGVTPGSYVVTFKIVCSDNSRPIRNYPVRVE